MATSQDTVHPDSALLRPPPLDESSRSSSTSSLDTNLVGHIEPTSPFRSLIFNAASKNDTAIECEDDVGPVVETPPDTTDGFETDFDDNRLPALPREHRRCSSPGLGGGEAKTTHLLVEPRRKSVAEGLTIPVELEKIKETGEIRHRYILKVDDELRELLAAGARERERSMRGKKGIRPGRGRFGDLIFTQRFTAFDRVNREGVKRFKGFFVLMWWVPCCLGFVSSFQLELTNGYSGSVFVSS